MFGKGHRRKKERGTNTRTPSEAVHEKSLQRLVTVARRPPSRAWEPAEEAPRKLGPISQAARLKLISEQLKASERKRRAQILKESEDRRRFNQKLISQHYLLKDKYKKLTVLESLKKYKRTGVVEYRGLKFDSPRKMWICAKRKLRREVLFALKLHGRGAGSSRKHKNEYSEIHCA